MAENEKDKINPLETEQEMEACEQSVSQQELAELNDKYLRLAADFQNYKRRTENEKLEVAAFANERIVKELLLVIDSFERALENDDIKRSGPLAEGVGLIYKQLGDVLKNFGVKEIDCENGDFDPNYHDAVLSEEAQGVPAGKILEVMQKGYTLNERLIRAAMVKVSI